LALDRFLPIERKSVRMRRSARNQSKKIDYSVDLVGSSSEEEVSSTLLNSHRPRGRKSKRSLQIDKQDEGTEGPSVKSPRVDESILLTPESDIEEEEEESGKPHAVKAVWTETLGSYVYFDLRPRDTLESVFEHFSKEKGCLTDELMATFNDKTVSLYDTPMSIGMTFSKNEVLMVSQIPKLPYDDDEEDDTVSELKVSIKCLLKDQAEPLIFYLHPNQPMRCLYNLVSSKLNCSEEAIKICFDGDTISFTDTPHSLELEGGECFDIYYV